MRKAYRLLFGLLILLISSFVYQPPVSAIIDVEMILNDGGFVSFDLFKAELYLNNHEVTVPDAWIFGILEIAGDYYYWSDFGTDVNYRELTSRKLVAWIFAKKIVKWYFDLS